MVTLPAAGIRDFVEKAMSLWAWKDEEGWQVCTLGCGEDTPGRREKK